MTLLRRIAATCFVVAAALALPILALAQGTQADYDRALKPIVNYNVHVRAPGARETTALSRDGSEGGAYELHDVAWRNLGDAGFPDRILWHKAVAATYPYYDITRVGLYGTSAGGQNALGGLPFHPEFYDAAVSAVGCHDNRMDKIWWNEQWMGWPLGTHYEDSSNNESRRD